MFLTSFGNYYCKMASGKNSSNLLFYVDKMSHKSSVSLTYFVFALKNFYISSLVHI